MAGAPPGAVAGETFEQTQHLDLGAILSRKPREPVAAGPAAFRAAKPNDDVGIGGQRIDHGDGT